MAEEILISTLKSTEVDQVAAGLTALAAYHNQVAETFSGEYPTRSIVDQVDFMRKNIESGKGWVYVIRHGEIIAGFCHVAVYSEGSGGVEHLFVDERYRGRGYGEKLMECAHDVFARYNIDRIDITVIRGNPVASFYEKFGYKPRLLVYSR